VGLLLLLGCFCHPAWGAGDGVEVRRMGLSKIGENTLLTVVLERAQEPQVSSRNVGGQPQLVVDFPRARAGLLPRHLEGDEALVRQVVTETASPGGGVRIILDLYPDRPYAFWKQNRPGQGGQTLFILGLKPDERARPVQARVTPTPAPPAPSYAQAPAEPSYTPAPGPAEEAQPGERVPETPEPGETDHSYRESQSNAAPGSFAELRRLIPQGANLLQALETNGWSVSESNRYDRPGRRFSRDFTLSNSKYPELAVKIAYLPANIPNTPNISVIMLTTDRVRSQTASEYQGLRQWSFAKIKTKYEDIGDFFEDALKPLRVKLREETKAIALRDVAVFQQFLQHVAPNNPQVFEEVMKHIREKVSPRFEGVQFTVSQKPLVFLNLVDFLYVKVYYVDTPR
jgi:hypothetical protein